MAQPNDAATTRSAIVTGAGSGIGQATAKRLASDGFAVVCFDLRGAALPPMPLLRRGTGPPLTMAT